MPDQKDRTLHMIGNAHIDPVWQWRWEEGREEVIATCRAALDRIEDTPGFVFCCGSAVTYQWLEEYAPDLFEEVKRRIAEGRWAIVNGWWVQPDCNIPCGESFVRHALYGKRYFLDRFGVEVRAGYNVDTFGHNAQLPQILAKSGFTSYSFFRPDPREKTLPASVFWWEAPDGTRLLTSRPGGHYGTGPDEIDRRVREACEAIPGGLTHGMCFYGVGNHGGGPTKENLASIARLDESPALPKLVFSAPEAFFEAIRPDADDLPVVHDELQYHSRGCYSAVSALKKANREGELALLQAEKLATLALVLLGDPVPTTQIADAWKLILFNQFHDILAGTSIKVACEDALDDCEAARAAAYQTSHRAMTAVAARIDTSAGTRALVAFNPLSWPRDEVALAETTCPGHDGELQLADADGRDVPLQVISENIAGRNREFRLAFRARVPALGYATYFLREEPPADQRPPLVATQDSIENDLVRIALDPETGAMSSLLDKRHGVELLAGPGNVLKVIRDESDTWSHGVDSFREEVGEFRADGAPQVFESGPLQATLRVSSRFGASRATQDITLCAGSPLVRVRMTVDWREQHRALKLCFPLRIEQPVATYEIPYGVIVREPDGNEQPAQKWIDVSGKIECDGRSLPHGCSLLNDCKYGFDVLGSEMRMTVLRSPIYCFHDPAQVDPSRRYEYTDQGPQTLEYALLPHSDSWREAGTVHRAQELNAPLIVKEEPPHPGALPRAYSLLQVSGGAVIAEVGKQAEDGKDVVLRAYEPNGAASRTEVIFDGHALGEFAFGPFEIKTLRLCHDGDAWRATETDMLERHI